MLWLDWLSLRVIRNSIAKFGFASFEGRTHGNDRSGAWRVVGRLGLEEDAAAVRARPAIEFFSPTYTGLGERAHLAHHEIDLTTHINDVAAVLDSRT